MTKDKLKDDIIRTICCLNSDISNKDRDCLLYTSPSPRD